MKSLSERTLMRACAKFILGESSGVRIKGKPERVAVFQEVLTASKRLYEALSKKRPLEEVRQLLEAKRAAAEKFKSVTGIAWQL